MSTDTPETFRVRAPQQQPGEAIERLANLVAEDDQLAAAQEAAEGQEEDQAEAEDREIEQQALVDAEAEAVQDEDIRMDRVYMVSVSTHRPRLNYTVRGANVEVNGVELSNSQATDPRWKLMPKEHKKKLERIELDVRNLCRITSIPIRSRRGGSHYIKGCYLVPESRLDELEEELRDLHTQLQDYVRDEIAGDISAFHEAIREQLGDTDAYREAARHIPTREHMLRHTAVEFTVLPLNLRVEEAEEVNVSATRRRARARTQELSEAIAESVVAEPRAELVRTLDALHELMSRDGQVKSNSVEPVKRAIEKLRVFGSMGDASLDRRIRELEQQIGSPGVLDSLRAARREDESVMAEAESNGLAEAMRNVREQAEDQASQLEAFGRYSRAIRF
jgi:hypothetical protein